MPEANVTSASLKSVDDADDDVLGAFDGFVPLPELLEEHADRVRAAAITAAAVRVKRFVFMSRNSIQ
jgi:hypothetical protein